jgi:hypothetical protein
VLASRRGSRRHLLWRIIRHVRSEHILYLVWDRRAGSRPRIHAKGRHLCSRAHATLAVSILLITTT